ncbi:MAG: hypothetical protein ACE5DU_04175 [Nitrosopumilus sp.]
MNKSLILLPIIVIPILFIMFNTEEKEIYSETDFVGQSAILKVGEDFINQATKEGSISDGTHVLNELREITETELLEEFKVPDHTKSEKIFNNGLKLSDNYNQISFEYSTEKLTDLEYLSKLLDFQIKYQKYMTAIDSYVGDEDILIHKNSMKLELEKINQDIQILKNSIDFEYDLESKSEYDKYAKFLPSMFES